MNNLAERIAQLSPAQRASLLAKFTPVAPKNRRSIDLQAEAALDASIVPASPFQASGREPNTLFMTGATGFLGAFLLHELLEQTQAKVYCLVRAITESAAAAKLRHSLSRYGLDIRESTRIVPVCGDISEPLLGLKENRFRELSLTMDLVLHNAAWVNFVYPYARLKPANVNGTAEALRLACCGRVKPLHYVSTLSVFGNEQPPDPAGFSEEDSVGPDADLGGGYAQSKWVAEQLVKAAATRGLPAVIYRPATIAGHSQTGVWNNDDLLCRLIKGCIQIGQAPQEAHWFNFVPVDYASRAIVHLSRRPELLGQTFHINQPQPLSSTAFIDWIKAYGYALERVPYHQWRQAIHKAVEHSSNHALSPLLPMFVEQWQGEERSAALYDCRKTVALLNAGEIASPSVDASLWRGYLRYLQGNGYLPPSDDGVQVSR